MEKDTAGTIVKVYAVLAWISALIAIVAGLFILGIGSMLGFGGMMGGYGSSGMMGGGIFAALGAIFGILMLVIAVFDVVVGYGLWILKPWARIAAIIMSVLSLFSFPIGTVIGAIGIWLFGFEPTIKSLFDGTTAKKKQ